MALIYNRDGRGYFHAWQGSKQVLRLRQWQALSKATTFPVLFNTILMFFVCAVKGGDCYARVGGQTVPLIAHTA